MSKSSKRKRRREKEKALSKLKAPVVIGSDDGQSPANHNAIGKPNEQRTLFRRPLVGWVSVIVMTGSSAFINHISNDPRILYFCVLTFGIWLLWQVWHA